MIFVIIGPTGSGKSQLAIKLALKYNGIIINGDAFQVYQEMDIGTAKPTEEDFNLVEHYLYNVFSPTYEFSIYDYQKILRAELKKHPNKNIFIVGGSGLYLKSALYDFSFVENKDFNINFDKLTNEELYDLLKKVDEESSLKIHMNNRKRVLRALEIFYSSGKKKSEIEKKQEHKLIYDAVFISYNLSREELYQRIDKRVDEMVEKGLFFEVENLVKKYGSNLKAFQAIGYKEIIHGKENKISHQEIINSIKKASRNYAKRQITYFKNQLPVIWISNEKEAFEIVENKLTH